ncbi:GEVED domain-containing protein [Ferruginibacter sp. HRS2-29]|uniref:GEVED domain-containing protein n=1 Tax=Ferruginibacter sp. HRS2-29 TaxID=2487334 RepID=UPI0020CEF13D|nr:GEVED domain-containing protein [Ferruginibacter sp. HRS2-29]MCP9751985.1 T9SS C-terminal target domain-containing protein [Ferruginibacter sp. HRS2-29]
MRIFYLAIIAILFATTGFAQTQTVTYTTTGQQTWTAPCGVTSITVECWGGGGAGGGATNGGTSTGSGGAGGAYSRKTIAVVAGTTYTLNVGAGGTGANITGTNPGGASWFSSTSTVAASGGAGGNRNGGAAGLGSTTGCVGDVFYKGGDGIVGVAAYGGAAGGGAGSTGNGGNATTTAAGIGTANGGGNGGGRQTANANGNNGVQFGGGGGGARRTSATRNGGDGAPGKVVITYTGLPGYCAPGVNQDIQPISLVNFSNINNATSATINGNGIPALEQFCDITGNVTQGTTYPITVKGNTGDYWFIFWFRFTDYYTAFIDWNQDGDFGDANERVEIGSIYSSDGTDAKSATTNITVPATATLGKTKMRIVKNYDQVIADACTDVTYGQIEDYILNITSSCTASVAPTLVTASATTVCSGTQVTLKQTGGTLANGYKWHWYSGSCGGTAVGVSTAADATFTFTPTGTATYYVRAEEGCTVNSACNTTGLTVTVNNAPTITYTSGNTSQNPCINGTFGNIVYTVGGGATGAVLSGAPNGITGAYNAVNKQFTISGSAVQSGTFNYTVTTTGAVSPCVNATLGGAIVVAPAPTSITYSTASPIYCTNTPIASNSPAYTGGQPTSYNITPALPAGLSIDVVTGIISGTPAAVSAATNYTITASNSCGFTTGTVNIQTTSGANLFTVSPNGNSSYCAGGSGVQITLPGSQTGVVYQLYRGATPVGSTVAGTGSAISFGNQTVAGTYTIRGTIGTCSTTMTGQAVIAVTPVPTTTFTFPSYSYCGVGTATPTITGAPQTGTFSASPAGLSINTATGVIDLGASTPGTYSITYTVAAAGGCSVYNYTNPTAFKVNSSPVVFDVFGGGSYCSGGTGVEIGLSGSQTGVNYQLIRSASVIATLPGTGTDISFGNQTVAGTYTIKAITAASPNCEALMNGSAVVTVNALPSAISVTPVTKTLCQNTIQSLEASYAPPGTSSSNTSEASGTINYTIPDNDELGTSSTLRVTGVPAGATITSIVVNFSATHSYVGDMVLNLKGPNGKVLNLANRIGGGGNNFTNTNISSIAATSITTAAAPFTGTYAPQAANSVAGATIVTSNISNATTFGDLYGASSSTANGNWTLSARDKDLFYGGTLKNWSITINYTYINNPVTVTWSPATDLYTNPGATIAYVAGANASTVYAKPSAAGTVVYTATLKNGSGCQTTATSTLNVSASPTINVSADYCSVPGKVRITATSTVPVPANSWTWSGGLTGTNSTTSSYIDVVTAGTYYVSAQSTANGCPGTGVMSIAQELIVNGDFESGNTSFTSDYTYRSNATANSITAAGQYSVHNDPNFLNSNFWGPDHTTATGEGNFLIANGTANTKVWKQTVTVIPNTDYYFSAYGVSLNDNGNYARLQFQINGTLLPSIGQPGAKDPNNNPGTWVRFSGTWNSGSNTSVEVAIVDLRTVNGTGNDFGIDDISFGTLSTFLNLSSATGSDNQSGLCVGTPIADITYEVGGDGNSPVLTGTLPPGVTAFWNGRTYKLSGTPTAGGTFNYTLTSTGCNPKVKSGTIVINQASDAGVVPAIASACYNTAGSISTTSSVGTVQKWQSSVDGLNWTNESGSTTTFNYPALTQATFYRVIVKNASCVADTSSIIKVGIKNMWTGNTDAEWTNTSNWSDETIPSATCPSVIIPVVNSGIYPAITSGTTDVVNIDVKTGASLTIHGGTLRVSGTITSIGGIDAKDGTIVLNGTSTQTIAGANLKDKTVKNLTIENNVSLTPSSVDTLKISGTLGFGNASGKTFAAGTNNVVLLSSRTNTANVPNIGNNSITGSKFTVERYVNTGVATAGNPLAHGRAWQLLSVPTNTTQTIHNAWQEGQATNADNLKGYGTLLNGPLAQGGYDNNSAGTYIKSYIPGADQWTLGNGTNAPIATKRGWMTFVMGDRSSNATNSKPTVLRTTGALFTGTQPTLTVTAGRYEVIGNPYASEIDLRELIKPSNNLTQQVYVWDPSLGAGFGFGRYRTLTFEDGDYYTIPASANYPEISNMIQSGQAFFVKSNGLVPSSVTFTEDVKSNGSQVVTRGGTSTAEKLRIDLAIAQGGTTTLLDGAIAFFKNEYSINADETDGAKLLNSGENAGFKTGGKYLSVDRRPSPVNADTLFVEMTGMKVQSYSWAITTANMNKPGRNAWLLDNFLGTRTPLSLDGITNVNFDITSNAASSAANRFSIVFSKIAGPLPVTFTGISATRNTDRSIAVKWSVENEINLDKYTVERSADGVNFTGIITADVTNSRNYGKNDLSPLAQDNYYRIKATSSNGQVQYSAIVKVAPIAVTIPASISVYPNPVEDKTMNLSFVNQASGTYQLQLINDLGQVMYSGSVKVTGNNDRKQVKLQTIKATGRYTLKVVAEDGTASSIQLLVQ